MEVSKISFFSLNLNLFKNQIKIGSGTGFFYEYNGEYFLITNYHVLTGREPKRPESLISGYPDSPDRISFDILNFFENEVRVVAEVNLDIDDSTVFLEHKDRQKGVDLVALKIQVESIQRPAITTQKDIDIVDDIAVEITSNLFIVGFPWGQSVSSQLPIWKKGTVASEPYLIFDDIFKMYIDVYSNPGMSGSPVFASEDREDYIYNPRYETLFKKSIEGDNEAARAIADVNINDIRQIRKFKYFRLMGVYSGRVKFSTNDPQIGIVWPITLIDQMINDELLVKHPYPPIKI